MAPALLDSSVAEWAFAAIASKAIAMGSLDEKAMVGPFLYNRNHYHYDSHGEMQVLFGCRCLVAQTFEPETDVPDDSYPRAIVLRVGWQMPFDHHVGWRRQSANASSRCPRKA